jgi:hypothetical protein
MSDPRISELMHFWCQDAYKKKYGVLYCWSHGKDDKLLKNAIEWCDGSFGHEACVNKMKDGMRAYLASSDGFITKDNHPFAMFGTSPHKWFVQVKTAEESVRKVPCYFCGNRGLIYYNESTWRCNCGWGFEYRKNFMEAPTEAFLPKKLDETEIANLVAKNPMNYLRGFIKHRETMKKCSPELHDKLAKTIKEVCGLNAVREELKRDQRGKAVQGLHNKTTMPLLPISGG